MFRLLWYLRIIRQLGQRNVSLTSRKLQKPRIFSGDFYRFYMDLLQFIWFYFYNIWNLFNLCYLIISVIFSIHKMEKLMWNKFFDWRSGTGCDEITVFMTKWMHNLFVWYSFITLYIKWGNFCKRSFLIGSQELVVTKWLYLWPNECMIYLSGAIF